MNKYPNLCDLNIHKGFLDMCCLYIQGLSWEIIWKNIWWNDSNGKVSVYFWCMILLIAKSFEFEESSFLYHVNFVIHISDLPHSLSNIVVLKTVINRYCRPCRPKWSNCSIAFEPILIIAINFSFTSTEVQYLRKPRLWSIWHYQRFTNTIMWCIKHQYFFLCDYQRNVMEVTLVVINTQNVGYF